MNETTIPRELALAAHAGTSWVPEQRAEQEIRSHQEQLAQDRTMLERHATTDEKRARLAEEWARYAPAYTERVRRYLSSRSRIVSSFIAGPSGFPFRRMEKRQAVVERRLAELLDFRERALTAIKRALHPELAPIMAGDADATERLGAKIEAAEALQERMKAINKAHERYLKDPASLESADLTENEKARVRNYRPAYSWEPHPIAPYQFSNNLSNIKRMRGRLASVTRAQATPDSVTEGSAARVEDCPAENRVRLFFPGKPAAEVRDTLKRHGFRWTPTLGCWQAYRNVTSLDVARTVAGTPTGGAA